MKRHNFQLAICTMLASLLTFFACGGGGKIVENLPPILGGTKHVTMAQSAGGGAHISPTSRIATLALFFQASGGTQYAETFEGFCATMPSGAATVTLNNAGVIVDRDDCAAQFFTDPIPGQEPIVTGAGTLQHLIVTAQTDGGAADSGVATVYVNGTATPITCTLGNNSRCVSADTLTAAAGDGDRISIKFVETAGTHYKYVRARVAKV